MIKVHRLNGAEVRINAELIEWVEGAPDTTITLATGNRFIVRESVEQVVEEIVEYRRRIYADKKVVNPIEGFVRK